jgi:S-DNA-T family DNA segregation ATPase FtsK/SpoIIIE
VTSAESERQLRLVRMLVDELKERKASPRAERQSIFLLIDSFGGLTAAADGSSELLDGVHRIFSEGPDVGIHTAAGADRPQAVPYRLADVAPQKWVMRLAEAADYTGLGLPRRSPADVPPGRAFVAGTGLALQIGRPLPDVGTAVAAQGAGAGRRADPPPGVRTLPDHVPLATLLPKLSIDGDVWQLPVGLADRDLQPYCLRLHRGEHAVVAGSARSGKTSVLGALATLVRRGAPDCRVVALLGKASSPLGSSDQLETVTRSVDELVDAVERGDPARPVLLLVDDANLVPDPTGRLEQLLAGAGPQLHAVAAGRTDDLRQAFGHWTQTVRKCRTGVVLKVAQPADGDAIGVTLPFARSYDTRPGRGYGAVDGEVEIVQVMLGEDRGA